MNEFVSKMMGNTQGGMMVGQWDYKLGGWGFDLLLMTQGDQKILNFDRGTRSELGPSFGRREPYLQLPVRPLVGASTCCGDFETRFSPAMTKVETTLDFF